MAHPYDTKRLTDSAEGIAEAARLLLAGEPVAVPTETVYGLAADATNADAVARIYAAKGRPSFNPLIVHVLDVEAAQKLGQFDENAARLAKMHWPGPLTLVVPRQTDSPIASIVSAGLDSIAIRVPAHPTMRALLASVGRPLAAPSANASGRISPVRADHVLASLDGRIAAVIDGGKTERGLESTIVAATGGPLRILRKGPLVIDAQVETGDKIEAPGQLTSHYAPRKPLRLNALEAEPDEYLIGFGKVQGAVTLSATADPIEAAAQLFDLLHLADASPKPRIAVAPIDGDGVAEAIRDRLNRAAAEAN